MTATVALLVAVGAGIGSGLRFLAARRLDGHWPVGTLLVNVVGSAFAGAAVATWAGSGPGAERISAALVVGFAGGLTTLSGLAVQVHELGWRRGTAYGVVTLLLAGAACAGGHALA